MSMTGNDALIEDLKYANSVVRKAKGKVSRIYFKLLKDIEHPMVYGLGDASYRAGEKAIGGQFVLLGEEKGSFVMPVFWKSKLIRKVCKSPKDAETLNMGILADICRHTANQIEQLLFGILKREKMIETRMKDQIKMLRLNSLQILLVH